MSDRSEAIAILKHTLSQASEKVQREFLAIITADHGVPESNQEPFAGPRRIWHRLTEPQQIALVKWLESMLIPAQHSA